MWPEPLREQGYAGEGPSPVGETMRATETLTEEHRVIERGLEALERAAEGLDRGDEVPRAHLEGILGFIQGFADGCHHQKEEGILFPYLEGKGLARQEGPLAVLLEEHDVARGHVRGMREAVEADDSHAFAAHARAYVALLRDHIEKEDQVLFPMAASMTGPAEAEDLWRAFEAMEMEEPGAHGRYLRLLEELEKGP